MKKLMLLLGFIALMFVGCEKEEETYCWDCKKDVTAENYYSSFTFEMCGLTYEGRADFEKDNSMEDERVKIVTTCHLK